MDVMYVVSVLCVVR